MMAFLRKLTSSLLIPIGWTLLTIILLCLPGSAFPSEGLFNLNIPHLDKVAHVILFGGIIFLWCLYYLQKNPHNTHRRFAIVLIALCTIALGICMEYIQFNFIPNRAFDTGDILANTLSTIACGMFFYFKRG
jgi:VanZ family protein